MYNQQHLFPAPQLNARYFKLDGPITLWLLRKDAPWCWDDCCRDAFNEVKRMLSSPQVLAHYDPDRPLKLACDASQYGDLNLFSTDKNLPAAAPASGCPRYLNDASANILRKALPLATQLPAQREPVFHSDPLADYLLRNQAEIPLSPWNDDPYAGLGAHASGARDPLSPVLLVGGYDNYQTARSKLEPTSVCFSYDLTKKLWQPLPNMARCRAYHASGCFDGTLFVIGGRSSNGEILSSVEALCLDERRQWQEMPCRLCRPRMAAGSTQMGGRLWLAGGLTDSRAGLVVISDVDCFDPSSCEFFYHVNFLPTPRCFFSLVAVSDKLFALGGCSVRDSELESLGDVWSCLDHCWERRGTFDQGYHDVATVAYGDRVFMVGGLSSDTKSGIRAVSCYRSTHNAFTPSLAPLPRALCGASVVVLPPMEMEVAANCAGLDGNRWTGNSRIGSDVAGEPLANTGKCARTGPVTDSGRSSSAGSPSSCRTQIRPRSNRGNPWHTWHRSNNDRPPSCEPTGAVIATAALQPERAQQPQQPPPRCAHSEYRAEANK
ncbi:hypothetical protein MRX96_038608 [Rhipicephalus microplus]